MRKLLLLLWFVTICQAEITPPAFSKINELPQKNLILAGDEAFKNRVDPVDANLALENYRNAVQKSERKDPQALSRLSMGCYFVGLRYIKDQKAQEELYREGRDAGVLASKIDPKCASCRFWAAINMALYGQSVGIFKMLFSLKEIQALLKESIQLDPTYAYSGAQRLQGLMFQKIPGILGGSNSKAKSAFEQAISASPNEPLNYLFLAKLLKDDLHDSKTAYDVIKKGLEIQQSHPATPDRLESVEAVEDLKKLQSDFKISS